MKRKNGRGVVALKTSWCLVWSFSDYIHTSNENQSQYLQFDKFLSLILIRQLLLMTTLAQCALCMKRKKNGSGSCRPEKWLMPSSEVSLFFRLHSIQKRSVTIPAIWQVFESPINETITVNDNPGPVCTVHEKKKTVAVVVALKSGWNNPIRHASS